MDLHSFMQLIKQIRLVFLMFKKNSNLERKIIIYFLIKYKLRKKSKNYERLEYNHHKVACITD